MHNCHTLACLAIFPFMWKGTMLVLLYSYLCISVDNWLEVKRLYAVKTKFHPYKWNKGYLLGLIFFHVWQLWNPARHSVYFPLDLMLFNVNTATDHRFIFPCRIYCRLQLPCFPEFHLQRYFVFGNRVRIECRCETYKWHDDSSWWTIVLGKSGFHPGLIQIKMGIWSFILIDKRFLCVPYKSLTPINENRSSLGIAKQ